MSGQPLFFCAHFLKIYNLRSALLRLGIKYLPECNRRQWMAKVQMCRRIMPGQVLCALCPDQHIKRPYPEHYENRLITGGSLFLAALI